MDSGSESVEPWLVPVDRESHHAELWNKKVHRLLRSQGDTDAWRPFTEKDNVTIHKRVGLHVPRDHSLHHRHSVNVP